MLAQDVICGQTAGSLTSIFTQSRCHCETLLQAQASGSVRTESVPGPEQLAAHTPLGPSLRLLTITSASTLTSGHHRPRHSLIRSRDSQAPSVDC
jgi:hypothetical protein